MDSNPIQAWIFSGFNYTTAEVVCNNCYELHGTR